MLRWRHAMRPLYLFAVIALATASANSIATPAEGGRMTTLPVEGHMPSLDGAVGWLNSKPLTTIQLRGKVVLIDFWTYTCVNWTRTLPYLRAWAQKDKASELVVIGVRTPDLGLKETSGTFVGRSKKWVSIIRWPSIATTGYGTPFTISTGPRSIWWIGEDVIAAIGKIPAVDHGAGSL